MYKFCTLAIIALSGLFTLTACGGAAAPTSQTGGSPRTLTIESICADNPFDRVCVSSTYDTARDLVVNRCTINPADCSAEVITCLSNPFDEKCVFVAYGEAYASARSSLVSTCATGSGRACNTALLTSLKGDNPPSVAACIADPFIPQCIQSNNFTAYRAPHIAACEANFNPATCTLAQAAVCAIGTAAHVNPFSALCTQADNEYENIRLRHADACRNGTNGNSICTGVTVCNDRPFATDCIENTAFVRARRDLIAKCIIGDAVLTNPDCTNAVADGETLTCLTNPYEDDCLTANQLGAAEDQSGEQSIVMTARMERLAYCGEADANPVLCGAEVLVDLCTVAQNPFSPLCVDPQGVTVVADAREAFVDKCRTDNPKPANCTGDIIACIAAPFGDDCTSTAYDNTRVAFAPSCNVAEADRPSGCTANVIACNTNPYDADAFDGAGCTRMFFPVPTVLSEFCLKDTAWSAGCDDLSESRPDVRAKREELAGDCLALDSAPYCNNAIGGTVGGQTVFSCTQTPYHEDCIGNPAFDAAKVAFCIADTAWDANCDIQAFVGSLALIKRIALAEACTAPDSSDYCTRPVGEDGLTVFSCKKSPLNPDCAASMAYSAAGLVFCTETDPWDRDCDIQATAGSDVRARREELAQACEDASAPPCSDFIGTKTVYSCRIDPFHADCVDNIAFNAAKVAYCTADATAWHTDCDESGADPALNYDDVRAKRQSQVTACVAANVFPCSTPIGTSGATVFSCKTSPFLGACNIDSAFAHIRASNCTEAFAWQAKCDDPSMNTLSVREQRGLLAQLCTAIDTFGYCSQDIGANGQTVFSCGQNPFHADCEANVAFNAARIAFCNMEENTWTATCDTTADSQAGDLVVIRMKREEQAAKCIGDSLATGAQPDFCTPQRGGRMFGTQTIQTCIVTPFHADCVNTPGFDVAKTAYCTTDKAWESECNGERYTNNPDVIAKREELAGMCRVLGIFDYCDYPVGESGQTVHTCLRNPIRADCAMNSAFANLREVFCTEEIPWHLACDALVSEDTVEGRAIIAARAVRADTCKNGGGDAEDCSRGLADTTGDGTKDITVRVCSDTPLHPDCVDNPAFADLVAVFCTKTNPWHEHCNQQAMDNPVVLAERKRQAVLCVNSNGYCGLPISVGSNFAVWYCIGDPLHRDCAANPAFNELGAVYCLEGRPWTNRCDDAANPDTEAGRAIIAKRAELADECIDGGGELTACSRRQGSLLVRDCRVRPFDPNCTNPAFNDIKIAHCAEKTTFWDIGCDTTDMIREARLQVVNDCNVVGTKPDYCRVKVDSATGPLLELCITSPFTTGCVDNPAFESLKHPYCDEGTRAWNAECDGLAETRSDILHKRRTLVAACRGNSQPDYCTERTFSEARYDTTTTVYTVRYAGRKLGNEHFGPPVLESDYGEGVVTKTEVTATDISESKQSSHAGPQYHGANGAVFAPITIEITVVTSVLREERETITLAECLANPFQEICAHRIRTSSLGQPVVDTVGPPVAGAAAIFDVYCGQAENAWKEDCFFNRYSDAQRNNDCINRDVTIENGVITFTNPAAGDLGNAVFKGICSRDDTASQDIAQTNAANIKRTSAENDAIIARNVEIDSENAARNMRNTDKAARNGQKTREYDAAMLLYQEITGRNALIMQRNEGRTTRNAQITDGQAPEVLEELLEAEAPVAPVLETIETLADRIALKQPAYATPYISVEAERKRRATRCEQIPTRKDCDTIIYEAITAGECVADEDLAGCDNVTSQEGIARVNMCMGDAGAAECGENAREAVTVGFCVKNPLDVDCLGERDPLGKNAGLCRADSSAPACKILVDGAGSPTIASCIENPYIKACSKIRTFFTAFEDALVKQLARCSGEGGETAYSDKDCRRIPENLTNLITRCREKSHANYDEEHCKDIRPQITACENADDPFNPLTVPDAKGVSCRNVAFDNLLTNHRNNCERDFTDGTRNATCKSIYDLTCVAGGTGRWVNLDSPLCLGLDGVKSYYREIAFCDLPTTSATHPACRTVPRNWRTWFDSATTDSSDSFDAIGLTTNSWRTDVGTSIKPSNSRFVAIPEGSETIDFTGFLNPHIHTLTLDSTRINLPNGGDRSDNDITANSGVNGRGAGSINHFQGDARDGIIFGRVYKDNVVSSDNRRFYAAILPTTDLGGPVQTSGTANWNGAVSYIRDDGDIIDVAGRGANLNTVNRAVNLSVNFSNRTIDGTFRIDHNNVVSREAEFMLLRMSYNPAGIIKGEVQLGRTHVSHPDTGRPTFVDGFRHDAGASKLTGIIGSEGAVGVFYTDGVVRQVNGFDKRVNHLVGGFVACPSKSVNGSPRCKTNGQ